jgi:hypothetical protein
MESHGGKILTGKTEELGERTCPNATLFHKSHMDQPGHNIKSEKLPSL